MIPHSFRFVSFKSDSRVFTHVYVVVPTSRTTVVMDAVMDQFNKEKPYQYKKDYTMTKIYQLSGIGENPEPIFSLEGKDLANLTEGEMDLLIAKDRLLTEKRIVENIRGVGSLKAEKYQDSIDTIDDMLDAANEFKSGKLKDIEGEAEMIVEDAENGEYSLAGELSGIGYIGSKKKRKKRKAARKAKRKAKKKAKAKGKTVPKAKATPTAKAAPKKKKKKTRGFFKKIAKGIKKGVKAIAKVTKKVVSAPVRLAMKGILEIRLPKAAPFFLYLFITDKDTIAKLPPKVKAKRDKAKRISNFIVRGVGMKRRHFMGIVRNGIMKKYKKKPERVIEEMLAGKMSGIGRVPKDVDDSLKYILNFVHNRTGEKINVSTANYPASGDFGKGMVKPALFRKPVAPKQVVEQAVFKQIRTAAPFFLYLFIKDPNILKKAPDIVQKKQKRQSEIAEFLVAGLGISREQFMALLRQGIVSRIKKTPEKLIADYMAGNVAGIGSIIGTAIAALISIISKVVNLIKGKKKKPDKVTTADAPEPTDWGEIIQKGKEAVEKFTGEVLKQPDATKLDYSDEEEEEMDLDKEFADNGGRSIWSTF